MHLLDGQQSSGCELLAFSTFNIDYCFELLVSTGGDNQVLDWRLIGSTLEYWPCSGRSVSWCLLQKSEAQPSSIFLIEVMVKTGLILPWAILYSRLRVSEEPFHKAQLCINLCTEVYFNINSTIIFPGCLLAGGFCGSKLWTAR